MTALEPSLIVVEVTGGYERAVLTGLIEADLPVARVSGYRARQYARAKGLLAKTDPMDAMNWPIMGSMCSHDCMKRKVSKASVYQAN